MPSNGFFWKIRHSKWKFFHLQLENSFYSIAVDLPNNAINEKWVQCWPIKVQLQSANKHSMQTGNAHLRAIGMRGRVHLVKTRRVTANYWLSGRRQTLLPKLFSSSHYDLCLPWQFPIEIVARMIQHKESSIEIRIRKNGIARLSCTDACRRLFCFDWIKLRAIVVVVKQLQKLPKWIGPHSVDQN